MKFIKENKKFFSLMLFICLILSLEVESTYKSISLSKYRNRARRASLNRNFSKDTPPFTNPLMNLLAGVKNILLPSDNGDNFYSCFPEKWRKNDMTPKERNGYFTKYTSFLQTILQKIIKNFPDGPILNFICENRKAVLDKIKEYLPISKRRVNSENYSYGKLNKRNKYVRKFREEWLINAAKNIFGTAKTIFKKGVDIVKTGANYIKEGAKFILSKVFSFIVKLKNFIVSVIKGLAVFFKDVLFTFVNCFLQNKTLFLGSAFAGIMMKLKVKFTKFQVAMASGLVLAYLANEFLGYVCMKKELQETNKLLNESFKTTNDNKKALFMGEGLANLLKTFANAN